MKKRDLVIFGLLLISVLFIIGCQETISKKPTAYGKQPNGDYICSDSITLLPAGSYTLAVQDCALAMSAAKNAMNTDRKKALLKEKRTPV